MSANRDMVVLNPKSMYSYLFSRCILCVRISVLFSLSVIFLFI